MVGEEGAQRPPPAPSPTLPGTWKYKVTSHPQPHRGLLRGRPRKGVRGLGRREVEEPQPPPVRGRCRGRPVSVLRARSAHLLPSIVSGSPSLSSSLPHAPASPVRCSLCPSLLPSGCAWAVPPPAGVDNCFVSD